jgi:hypothetical protein
MKEALLRRTQESHSRRDDTGMYGDIFLDIEGLQKWKCSPSTHLIDIIPYQAGDKDPNTKPGEWTYLLDIWVHGNVGPNQDSYICLARSFKQPCPICEYREQLRLQEDYDEEEVKSLYPIRRVAYNIICYDDVKEESKGVQIFLVSHFHMEKKLMAIAKLPSRGGSGGGYVPFSDPDDGKSIQFERKGGRDNTEYLGHQFVPREGYTISDEVLKSAYQLDQIIHIPSYNEVHEAFFGRSNEISEEAPSADEGAKPSTDEPPPQEEKTHPSRLLRRGQPPMEAPPATLPPQPTRGQPKGSRTKICPHGGTFGVDCENLKECGDCELWDDCSAQSDVLKAKETSKPEQSRSSKPTTAPTPTHRPIRGARR